MGKGGTVVTQTVLGGLTIHPPAVYMCHELWMLVGSRYRYWIIINRLFFWATLYVTVTITRKWNYWNSEHFKANVSVFVF